MNKKKPSSKTPKEEPFSKSFTKNEVIERLAELEHEQWMKWAKTLTEKEKLSQERLDRWFVLFCPYEDLPEKYKEYDRVWARKVYNEVVEGLVADLMILLNDVNADIKELKYHPEVRAELVGKKAILDRVVVLLATKEKSGK